MKNAAPKAPLSLSTMRDRLEHEIAGDGKTIQTRGGTFVAYCDTPATARRLLALINHARETAVPRRA
jgi:hypothetical protein